MDVGDNQGSDFNDHFSFSLAILYEFLNVLSLEEINDFEVLDGDFGEADGLD